MNQTLKNGLFTPELLKEIRGLFIYPDRDPYTGQRVYWEASGGSLRLKSVVDTITREAALPDELYRFNPASDAVVDAVDKGTEALKA